MAIGNTGYTPKKALYPADVVDNLESSASDLPVSARMVKELSDRIGYKLNRGIYRAYVNTDTGNDTTGDGTQSNSYKSIQRAIAGNPSYGMPINDVEYQIYVSGSTKDPGLDVRGNYFIHLMGENAVNIEHIGLADNAILYCEATLNVKTDTRENPIIVERGGIALFWQPVSITGLDTGTGVMALNHSFLRFASSLNISNFCTGLYSYASDISTAAFEYSSIIGDVLCAEAGTIYLSEPMAGARKTTFSGGEIRFYKQGWQFLGSAIGTQSIGIDSGTYDEFLVTCKHNGYVLSVVIPSTELNVGGHFCNGSLINSSMFIDMKIIGTSTYIFLEQFTNNTENLTNEAAITVYGRR